MKQKKQQKKYWIVGIVVAVLLVIVISLNLSSNSYEGRLMISHAVYDSKVDLYNKFV